MEIKKTVMSPTEIEVIDKKAFHEIAMHSIENYLGQNKMWEYIQHLERKVSILELENKKLKEQYAAR